MRVEWIWKEKVLNIAVRYYNTLIGEEDIFTIKEGGSGSDETQNDLSPLGGWG